MTFDEGSASSPLWQRGVDPNPDWTRTDLIAVAVLTLMGLAVRLPGLDYGLWFDEIQTLVQYARLPAAEIVQNLNKLNNHILYSLLAHLSIAWFGDSVWALRLPSLVFGVATIPAVYWLCRQLTSREQAFLVTLFLAINYFHVFYSQSARGYTGSLLGVVVASILFIRLMATPVPSGRLVATYAAVAALGFWMQMTAIFVLAVHGVIWLVLGYKGLRRGQVGMVVRSGSAFLIAGIIVLVFYAPIFHGLFAMNRAIGIGGDGTSFFIAKSSTASWTREAFLQGLSHAMPGGWIFLSALLAAIAAGVHSYARQSLAVAALLILPAVFAPVAVLLTGMLFFPRLMFSELVFAMLLSVRGGYALAGRLLPFMTSRQVLAAGVTLALLAAFMLPGAWKPKQDFKAAVGFVSTHLRAGDGVACVDLNAHMPVVDYGGMNCELVESVSDLERMKHGHSRIWVFLTFPYSIETRQPALWKKLTESGEFRQIKVFAGSLGGGDIHVLLRQAGIDAGDAGK